MGKAKRNRGQNKSRREPLLEVVRRSVHDFVYVLKGTSGIFKPGLLFISMFRCINDSHSPKVLESVQYVCPDSYNVILWGNCDI